MSSRRGRKLMTTFKYTYYSSILSRSSILCDSQKTAETDRQIYRLFCKMYFARHKFERANSSSFSSFSFFAEATPFHGKWKCSLSRLRVHLSRIIYIRWSESEKFAVIVNMIIALHELYLSEFFAFEKNFSYFIARPTYPSVPWKFWGRRIR